MRWGRNSAVMGQFNDVSQKSSRPIILIFRNMISLTEKTILSHVRNAFPSQRTGRPRSDPKAVLDSIVLVLRTGMPWRSHWPVRVLC